jgi:hypothetical protein
LEHYLNSLNLLDEWVGRVRLALCGHNGPVKDLHARIQEIREIHDLRIAQTINYFKDTHTIDDLSRELFGKVTGYNVLLALEEAGAHVEYLYQRGKLSIENLVELNSSQVSIPIKYRLV